MRSLRRVLIVFAGMALVGCTSAASVPSHAKGVPIRIGAVFPLGGNAAGLAGYELRGVQIAADLVNADGGVDGRRVVLDVRDLESGGGAPAVMAALRKRAGVHVVIGAYGSDLSIAASQAADAAGLVYWEAGAVADRLTGRGLPMVFRVGASGSNLGSNSAAFAAAQLAPRLGRSPAELRVAIVSADDAYATSVADAAAATAASLDVPVVARTTYRLVIPDWDGVMADLAAARPDVIILASHIPDGVAFRRAMLASGLKVGALIGSTMAECDPDFAGELGAAAIGIFASDRPTAGFQPDALTAAARATYDRFAAALGSTGIGERSPDEGGGYGYGGDTGYAISGPGESASAAATEEALSGFSAAWALFHEVLPAAGSTFEAAAIASAARAADLPAGSLPNGAGLRFASDPDTLGQNERAAAVIWQWQAVQDLFVRLAGNVRDGFDRLRPAALMAVVIDRPGRSAGRTAALLLIGLGVAAVVRATLNGHSAASAFAAGAAFGTALVVMALLAGWRPVWPSVRSLLAGVVGGLVVIAIPRVIHLLVPAAIGMRPEPFVAWVAVTGAVVVGEEAVLRGALFDALAHASGAVGAVLITSLAFALIHVPLYGWQVVPLDFGVGVWFAGLRLATAGIGAPIVAHLLADLSTWWL